MLLLRLAAIAITLLACGPADALNLTCTLPNAAVTRAQELCEELRLELRVRASEWSNNVCASQMLRLGLIQANKVSAKRAGTAAAGPVEQDVLQGFNPLLPPPTKAACGDAIVDSATPFNETCDDGNRNNGDGCDDSCHLE